MSEDRMRDLMDATNSRIRHDYKPFVPAHTVKSDETPDDYTPGRAADDNKEDETGE